MKLAGKSPLLSVEQGVPWHRRAYVLANLYYFYGLIIFIHSPRPVSPAAAFERADLPAARKYTMKYARIVIAPNPKVL